MLAIVFSSKSANIVVINDVPNSHTQLTCVSRCCFARCEDSGLLSRALGLSSDEDDNALKITYTSLFHGISFVGFVHLWISFMCFFHNAVSCSRVLFKLERNGKIKQTAQNKDEKYSLIHLPHNPHRKNDIYTSDNHPLI